MLHQTHHPYPYNYPFHFSSTKFSSSSSSLVEKGEMGRIVKGGLTPKMILEDVGSGFAPQFNHKFSYETVSRDQQVQLNPPSSVVVVDDDFFVDQLLNLNNEEIIPSETLQIQPQQDNLGNSDVVPVNSQQKREQFDEDIDKDTPFLSPPLDTAEEADLEWLSNFVDDSSCSYSTPFPPNYVHPKPSFSPAPKPGESKPAEEVIDENTTPLSLRRARRRNRGRAGVRVWAASQSDPNSPPGSPTPEQGTRKRERLGPGLGPGPGFQKRCCHCGVQKTPQWRAGPNGAKTLCNACGVRYKSGRLLPEYRPACSPTFSSELHSNSHRKVMEMRIKNVEARAHAGLLYPKSKIPEM